MVQKFDPKCIDNISNVVKYMSTAILDHCSLCSGN